MASPLTACHTAPDTLPARPASRHCRSFLAEGPLLRKCWSHARDSLPRGAPFSLTIGCRFSRLRCASDADGTKRGNRKGKRTKKIGKEVLDRQRDGLREGQSTTVRLRREEDGARDKTEVRNAWTIPVTIAAALMAGAASALLLGPVVLPAQQKVEDDISMERIVARQLTRRLQEMQPDELAAVLQDIMGPGKLSAPALKASATLPAQSLQEQSSAEKDREQAFRADEEIAKTREAEAKDQRQNLLPGLSRFMGAEMAAELEGGNRVTAKRGLSDAPSLTGDGRSQAVEGAASSNRDESVPPQVSRLSAGAAAQDLSVETNSASEEAGADVSAQDTPPPGEDDDVTLERLRVAGIDVDSLLALRPKSGLEAATPQDTGSPKEGKSAGSLEGPVEAAVEQVRGLRVDVDALFAPARNALQTVEFEKGLQNAQTTLKSFGPAQALEGLRHRSLQAFEGLRVQELPLQAGIVAGVVLTGSLAVGAYQKVSRRQGGNQAGDFLGIGEGEAKGVAWQRLEPDPPALDPSISQDKRSSNPADRSRSKRSNFSADLSSSTEDIRTRGDGSEPVWVRQDDDASLDIQRSVDVDNEQAQVADVAERANGDASEGTSSQGEEVSESSTEGGREDSKGLGSQRQYSKAWSDPRIVNGQEQDRTLRGSLNGKPVVNSRPSDESPDRSRPSKGNSFGGGADSKQLSERGSVSQLLGRRRPKVRSRGLEFLSINGGDRKEHGHSEGDDIRSRADSFRFRQNAETGGEVVVSGDQRKVRGKMLEERRGDEGRGKLDTVPSADPESKGANEKIGSRVAQRDAAMQGTGGARSRTIVVGKATTVGQPEQQRTPGRERRSHAPAEERSFSEASVTEEVPVVSVTAVGSRGTSVASDSRSGDVSTEGDHGRRAALAESEQERRARGSSRGLHFWATRKGDAELPRSPFLLAAPEGRSYSRHALSSTESIKERQVLLNKGDVTPETEPQSVWTPDSPNGSAVKERAPVQSSPLLFKQLSERQSGRRYARLSLGSSSTMRSDICEAQEATHADPESAGSLLERIASLGPKPETSKGQSENRRSNGNGQNKLYKNVVSMEDSADPDSPAASPGPVRSLDEIEVAAQRATIESRVQEEDKRDGHKIQDDGWREAFRLSRQDVWAKKSA